MRFSAGQVLEGLEFLEVLRSSDDAVAYKVRDTFSQRLEFLKLVPARINGDKEAMDRFTREARVHASLDHENIARFYSARQIDGEVVMTCEWVEGESLAQKLLAGPLPRAQCADYVKQTLAALSYAHAKGVVHRNITSANLLVTEQGVVKITGFGLARGFSDPRLTRTGVPIGTVHYMSPEQVQGTSELDIRSDLYSLGVVLYEALTGTRPYERENHFDVLLAHVEAKLDPPSVRNPEIPEPLEQVVLRAMAKNPEDRFQTADEFLWDLKAAVDQDQPSAKPELVPESPPPPPPLIEKPAELSPPPALEEMPPPVLTETTALPLPMEDPVPLPPPPPPVVEAPPVSEEETPAAPELLEDAAPEPETEFPPRPPPPVVEAPLVMQEEAPEAPELAEEAAPEPEPELPPPPPLPIVEAPPIMKEEALAAPELLEEAAPEPLPEVPPPPPPPAVEAPPVLDEETLVAPQLVEQAAPEQEPEFPPPPPPPLPPAAVEPPLLFSPVEEAASGETEEETPTPPTAPPPPPPVPDASRPSSAIAMIGLAIVGFGLGVALFFLGVQLLG